MARMVCRGSGPARLSLLVRGVVQGTGFRGHVRKCAEQHGIEHGYVRNLVGGGVRIVAQGPREVLTAFEQACLKERAPASFTSVKRKLLTPFKRPTDFHDATSDAFYRAL